MPTPIKIPSLGTATDVMTLLEWTKKEGEDVGRGDILCRIETDKAVTELESVAKGVLLKIVVPPQTEIREGDMIAWIGESGEQIPEAAAQDETGKKPQQDNDSQAKDNTSKSPVPPLIRNLAKKLGVDLNMVSGTGPGGRITREDLQQAAVGETKTPQGASLSVKQSAVAHTVLKSHREIPPINLICPIDMSAAFFLRSNFLQRHGTKVSFDAIVLYVISRVIKNFPHFLSHLSDDRVIREDGIHLGFALGIGDDLYTPVVRDADKKSLSQLEDDIQSLVAKAKGSSLGRENMAGAVFTISNLGMYPIESFSITIPPGQSASLSIGKIVDTPIVRDGEIFIINQSKFTLAVDHRMINGREAAQFLQELKTTLEDLSNDDL